MFLHSSPFHACLLQVAEQFTSKDVITAHARDELGIDLEDMSNPLRVSV